MNDYDNDNDYHLPYHWFIREYDFYNNGVMYFGYLRLISEVIEQYNLNNKKHLDVGCGDGRATYYIASNNNTVSTGTDISKRAIAFARLICENNDICFINENIHELYDKYDLITTVEVLEHIPIDHINGFVTKISELLVDEGYFIGSVPSKNLPLYLHKGHVQHFTEKSITDVLVNTGFEVIEIIYQYNMKYSNFMTKNRIVNMLYLLLNNKYYTIKRLEGVLARTFYKYFNRCSTEDIAARYIFVAKKCR